MGGGSHGADPLAVCTALLLGLVAPFAASAQDFPSRPVRYILPLPAGGETDVFARVLARQLTDSWRQQVIVDNRPGGGTVIGTDLAGNVPLVGNVVLEVLPYIRSGRVRPIAVTGPKRTPSLPDVPTVGESLPSYRAGTSFWALLTRAGAPTAVVKQLNADVLRAMQAPDVRERIARMDLEPVGSTPVRCDAFLREQVAVWGRIVKASGARAH